MNNKGLTLVELLAVIVILAIIALIATPIVIGIINDSRSSAKQRSAEMYLDAATKSAINYQMNHLNATVEGECTVQSNGNLLCDSLINELPIAMSGETAKCGKIVFTDGKITNIENLAIGGYEYNGHGVGDLTSRKVEDEACGAGGSGESGEQVVYLKDKILSDNTPQSDAGIDFTHASNYGSSFVESISETPVEYHLDGEYVWTETYVYKIATGKFRLNGGIYEEYYSNNGQIQYFCPIDEFNSTDYECDSIREVIDFDSSTNTATVYEHTTLANIVETNGKGLYYPNGSANPTYYFRGAVNNNYLNLNGTLFRIVRINEDGSIRIVLADALGTSNFNATVTDNAHIGYMNGASDSDNYADTHANTTSSSIKQYLDNLYVTYFMELNDFIADPGFCGDRSLYTQNGYSAYVVPRTYMSLIPNGDQIPDFVDTGLGYGDNLTFYGGFYRANAGEPTFQCINKNDLYTVSNEAGNKALTYPIGLLSVDEVMYAGGAWDTLNIHYYLYLKDKPWWTMSPALYGGIMLDQLYEVGGVISGAKGIFGDASGSFMQTMLGSSPSSHVRPVINLKADVAWASGNGTESSPYMIQLRG